LPNFYFYEANHSFETFKEVKMNSRPYIGKIDTID